MENLTMEQKSIEKIEEIAVEKSLRKCENLKGSWTFLGNGENWCIPAMPLGKKRKPILEKLTEIAKLEDQIIKLEDAKPEEKIKCMDDFMDCAFDLFYLAIVINYPNLTKDKFEYLDLFSLSDIPKIVMIVKGESNLAELLPEEIAKEINSNPDPETQKKMEQAAKPK